MAAAVLAHATPEMPVIPSEEHAEFLDNLGFYPLAMDELRALAGRLVRMQALATGTISTTETANTLRNYKTNGVTTLFLAMSRAAITFMVYGTVSRDRATCSPGTWYAQPSEAEGEVAGIYVISLRATGDSKFLTCNEMLQVGIGVRRYIRACEARSRPQRTHTAADKRLLMWLSEVDSAYMPQPWYGDPRFISEDGDTSSLEQLVRLIDTRSRAIGSDGNIRHIQSPLYVGCSVDLRRRISQYTSSTLSSINKPLALFMSVCMVSGFPVTPDVSIAIRTWQHKQPPVAEQLVAAIADSFLPKGFNACDAGGKSDLMLSDAQIAAAEEVALRPGGIIHRNLEDVKQGQRERQEFMDTVDALSSVNNCQRKALDSLARQYSQMTFPQPDEVKSLLSNRLQQSRKLKELICLRKKIKVIELVLQNICSV